MAAVTFVEAVRDGLREEMRRDPRVWALGEDLGYGGLYGQYKGLLEEFGPQRIVSTPISEAIIASVGLGGALAGSRPVVEMRIADFALCAWDEIVNQIAKIRYMFGGQCRVPIVIRMPQGANKSLAAQHSQVLEACLVHIPGLVVLTPATPADGKGMLKAAIRSDDPVVLLEPKALWSTVADVPDGEHLVEIGVAATPRKGSDVTLVTWSALVPIAVAAAEVVAAEGISVEVIDLRSLWPWDKDAVLRSVAKTNRLLIAHEAVQTSGFGAEVFAAIAESDVSPDLQIRRIGAPRMPVPFSPPLEEAYRVKQEDIVASVRKICSAKRVLQSAN